MAAGEKHAPDWRDAAAYEPLLAADRSLFAWEWLRRQPDYRAAALAAAAAQSRRSGHVMLEQPEAARWRLHAFVDPTLAAPAARPVWKAEAFPCVLRAVAEPSEDNCDALVLKQLQSFATVIVAREVQHLLFSDGYRGLRLDVRGTRLSDGPVRLQYDLSGFRRLSTDLLTLRRLAHLVARGRFSTATRPPLTRARRMLLVLRTFDALRAGVSQRSIAGELLSNAAIDTRWRVHAPSVRSQAQRLVRTAVAMATGGFWELLRF